MEKEVIPKGKHVQKEAFCLMKYRCENCRKEELIWNSRDGVTPFAIGCSFCKSEGIMQHVDWTGDKYLPDHFSKRGDRVFITMPDTILHLILKVRVEACWLLDPPYSMRDRYSTKEEAFKALLQDSHSDEGQPYLLQL